MRSWTIGRKLVLGFGTVMVITAALGTLAFWNGTRIGHNADVVANEVAPTAVASGQIVTRVMDCVFQAWIPWRKPRRRSPTWNKSPRRGT